MKKVLSCYNDNQSQKKNKNNNISCQSINKKKINTNVQMDEFDIPDSKYVIEITPSHAVF